MKARYLVACVFIFALIAVFLMRSKLAREAQAPQQALAPTNHETATAGTASVDDRQQVPLEKTSLTRDVLAGAYRMAAFIDQVAASVPSERESTRSQLRGLQALFFVSDCVMIAKTNGTLSLSASEVIAAYSNASKDLSTIRNRLATYAERPGTLADHYRSISENAEAKEQIKQIKAALTENGVVIDAQSDLLMDAIRYATALTEINEMYGSNPRKAQEATPFPAALSSMVNASETVFRQRFVEKHGLDPLLVTDVMNRLGSIRVFGLSPADMEIPARIR